MSFRWRVGNVEGSSGEGTVSRVTKRSVFVLMRPRWIECEVEHRDIVPTPAFDPVIAAIDRRRGQCVPPAGRVCCAIVSHPDVPATVLAALPDGSPEQFQTAFADALQQPSTRAGYVVFRCAATKSKTLRTGEVWGAWCVSRNGRMDVMTAETRGVARNYHDGMCSRPDLGAVHGFGVLSFG